MYSLYAMVQEPETQTTFGTGWLPPLPDMRDFTVETPQIADLATQIGIGLEITKLMAPNTIDLRGYCSEVENQGSLGSCTANAAVGIVEYSERRAYGKYIDGSRLFIYKTTRNLLGVTGDTGAWLRNTIGALVLCGVPDERYWPYTDKKPDFDNEPTSFVYAVADNYKAIKYFCHDPLGKNVAPKDVLASVKKYLAAGIPSMFGFFGFPSFWATDVPGDIPYPCPNERAQWGHAVAAVGYDDKRKITNKTCNTTTTGALLIRNSWGKGWGDQGYGWLPYDYVLNQIAIDFWSLLSLDWVQTDQFHFS